MTTFNFTAEMERLIGDISARMDEFAHIDPSRILVCVSSTRSGGVHGVQAKIHPLRFSGGAMTREVRRGRRRYLCTMPAINHQGREILYLIYFLSPRFFNLPLREKLITIIHELYHISPSFDGDIRRFAGRNFAHGSSTRKYNALMANLADRYRELLGDTPLPEFLNHDLDDLRNNHRAVVAHKLTAPRIKISPLP